MEKRRFKAYEIDKDGGTQSLNLQSIEETVIFIGSGELTSGYTVGVTGTPQEGMSINVIYTGNFTYSGGAIIILGEELTADEAVSNLEIRFFYFNGAWNVVKKIHNDDLTISSDDIGVGTLDGSVLIDDSVTFAYIGITDEAAILKGDGAGGSEEVSVGANELFVGYSSSIVPAGIGGDVEAIYDNGTGDLEFTLVNDVVGVGELYDIIRGSLIVGGVGNNPTLKDVKTSGHLLGGDGTDMKSLEVGGDVEVSYNSSTEKFDFNVGSFTSVNDLTATGAASGVPIHYLRTDLASLGKLDGTTQNLIQVFEGDIITRLAVGVGGASSPGTATIGYDNGVTLDDLIVDIDLAATGKTEATFNDLLYYEIGADGWITIESSTNITDGEANFAIEILRV